MNDTLPAYEQKVWSYEHAPPDYRALFPPPENAEYRVFIVWDRRIAPKSLTEWVTPNGIWWSLWHKTQQHVLSDTETVYMLVEMTSSL